MAECSNHLPKTLIDQCRLYYDKNVHQLTSVDGPCIIHRDFRAGNVIVHDGKIQGIIDWSSGRASFAEDDFCPMEHGEWPSDPITQKSFLSGYATIRPLPNYRGNCKTRAPNKIALLTPFLAVPPRLPIRACSRRHGSGQQAGPENWRQNLRFSWAQ